MMDMTSRIDRVRSFKREGINHHAWQRRKLWEHDPRCYWCGQVTVLPDYKGNRFTKSGIKPNWATLDHLDAKHSPERGKHEGEFRHVLSCWKCNGERDRRQVLALPIQERWERSGQLVKMAKL